MNLTLSPRPSRATFFCPFAVADRFPSPAATGARTRRHGDGRARQRPRAAPFFSLEVLRVSIYNIHRITHPEREVAHERYATSTDARSAGFDLRPGARRRLPPRGRRRRRHPAEDLRLLDALRQGPAPRAAVPRLLREG